MKKILALILTVCIVSCAFIGCTGGGEASTGANVEAQSWKIGFITSGSTDEGQALPQERAFRNAVEALNCEAVFVTIPENTAPGVISSIESLLNQNCDGIVLINMVHMMGLTATVIDMCEAAGVYVSFFNTLIEEGTDAYEAAMESDYFVSSHYNDNAQAAYNATKALADMGITKICYYGHPDTNPTGKYRLEGVQKAVADFGMELLTYNSDLALLYQPDGAATLAENLITGFPDMEGVVLGVGAAVTPAFELVAASVGREIAISGIDFFATQSSSMGEDGILKYMTGGHVVGGAYAAIMMINKLNGTPLVDEGVFIEDYFLAAQNQEEAEVLDTCYFGVDLFTAEEIREHCIAFNPDATYEKFLEFIKGYSADQLMQKYQ